MDTKLIIQTMGGTSFEELGNGELTLLMGYLNWIRNNRFSEYKAIKGNSPNIVDIVISDRQRIVLT